MPKNPEQFEKLTLDEGTEPKITPEEYQKRLERLRNIGRVIGEDFGMDVDVGKKPGWRYIFKPVNKIEVDPNDIKEKGLDYCFGIISHEGAHRKISKTDFVPKKIWQERGFSFLMNAVEDPRVNNWVSEKYDGAKEWLEKVYDQDLPAEEKVADVAKEKIGYIPKHIQFGSEIIRYWHTGKFSKELPKDVKNALNKTIKYAELAYQSIPEVKNPSKKEITEAAKRAYKIVYSAIWPEYQKLLDKALEDEKTRQMIKDMLENGEIEISDENKTEGGEPLPLDRLPEDLRKKLEKKIKEKLDSMPKGERKKFKEDIGKRAGKTLDELEKDGNKELKGKFSEQPKSKLEEEREKAEKEKERKRKEGLEKAKEEIEKELEAQKTEYDKAYEEVGPYIDKVAEDITNLLLTERWPKFKKAFPGQRLRLKGAMKYAAKKEYTELFETRKKMERKGYDFLLLVDLSGSMSGQKIEETSKGVVLFAEALNRVASTIGGVKVAIYGFQDDLIEYKKFEAELNDKLREKMSVMKKEVNDDGEHNKSSYNNDGYCLNKASKILEDAKEKNKFLFVLSDGEPEGDDKHHISGYNETTEEEELLAVVENISKNTNQKILGIGLGLGTDHVKKFYSEKFRNVENIPNVNVKKLSENLSSKLEKLVK